MSEQTKAPALLLIGITVLMTVLLVTNCFLNLKMAERHQKEVHQAFIDGSQWGTYHEAEAILKHKPVYWGYYWSDPNAYGETGWQLYTNCPNKWFCSNMWWEQPDDYMVHPENYNFETNSPDGWQVVTITLKTNHTK